MSAHTPGPWMAQQGTEDDKTRWIIVSGGKQPWHIATVENGQPGDTLETEEHTARLIAAAPELLVACKRALEWQDEDEFGNVVSEEYCTPEYREFRKQLRGAIAKAEAAK